MENAIGFISLGIVIFAALYFGFRGESHPSVSPFAGSGPLSTDGKDR